MAENQINHLETTSNETEIIGETKMEKCTALITGITGQVCTVFKKMVIVDV